VNILKWALILVAALTVGGGLFLTVSLFVVSRQQPGTEELDLGVEDGRLTSCPKTPNCVSTQATPTDETHYVEPIAYKGDAEQLLEMLTEWIRQQPRAEIVRTEGNYLRAVFTSRVFGFHDDLEIYFPEGESVVHLRSASRVGQGDMGVNRKRYQAIRSVIRDAAEDS
jgi:uncharacterized protein (DUF1499 family)